MKLNLCFPNFFSFNGGGFLRKKDTSYPHAYGALENAYAFGLVIVGGMIFWTFLLLFNLRLLSFIVGASSGSSTELSHDGYAWVKGPGFPYQNNQGVSSVSIDGNVFVFGGTTSKNKGYKLTVQVTEELFCQFLKIANLCEITSN